MGKQENKPVPVRLDLDLRKYVREKAHKADRSMNWMIQHIVRKHREREEGSVFVRP